MKVCPQCQASFAEGFVYCPADATELLRYDLRARVRAGNANELLFFFRGLPCGLTEAAIEAAKRIRFQPALRNGAPVSVRAQLEYNFALY
jgi:hypothetical protein